MAVMLLRARAGLVASLLGLLGACGKATSTSTSTVTGTTGTGGSTTSSSGMGGAGGAVTTGSGGNATSSGGADAGCATSPTFAEVLAKPLTGCNGLEPPCHNSGAGGLSITPGDAGGTWAQLVNVPAMIPGAGFRVVPGDAAHSFLYRKLINDLQPNETPAMPEHSGIPIMAGDWKELPPDEIEMVRCWIEGGAKND
jgi:hypothetical protein